MNGGSAFAPPTYLESIRPPPIAVSRSYALHLALVFLALAAGNTAGPLVGDLPLYSNRADA